MKRAWAIVLLLLSPAWQAAAADTDVPEPVGAAVERAHAELWRRFVDRHGILLDYVTPAGEVIVPTPAECAACKPNGLAWWCPIENGAFFNGLYLAGLCNRWAARGKQPDDAASARRIAGGLRLLAEVGTTPGFIARGVATDDRSHYPAGSDDQTLPWFYGLYRYVQSGIPSPGERQAVVRQMLGVATALEKNGWQMPCDLPSLGNRGSFADKSPVSVPRLLFLARSMSELTGDAHWQTVYQRLRDARPPGADKARLEICGDGSLVAEHANLKGGYYAFWTKASCQACLRALRDLSTEAEERRAYDAGLRTFGRAAAAQIGTFRKYSRERAVAFNHDWRVLDQWWRPQRSVDDFLAVAGEQAKHWHSTISPAKDYEGRFVREPLFAAWIVLLSGDRELIAAARNDIRAALQHYDWEKLNFSTFFAAECVYFEGLPFGL